MKTLPLFLGLLCAPAFADRGIPLSNATRVLLPNGLALEVKDGGLCVVRDGQFAAVPRPEDRPGYDWPVTALTRASATDDRTRVTVRFTGECGLEDEQTFALNDLWARSEDAQGLSLLRSKNPAAAAKAFLTALRFDPGFEEAAAHLAAAYLAAGKTPDALDALSGLIAKAPAKTYLLVLTDPDLAAILKEPRLANLAASVPGTASLKLEEVLAAGQDFTSGRRAAYEPVRGIAAAVVYDRASVEVKENDFSWVWSSDLAFVDAKTGSVLARLPLVDKTMTEPTDSYNRPVPVRKSKAIEVQKRVALANRALAELGLQTPEQVKPVPDPKRDSGHGNNGYAFPGTQLGFSGADLVKGETKIARIKDAQLVSWSSYLPGPGLVVVQWGQHPSSSCPRNAYDGIAVLRP
ncbi:MAG: tetratricopeptide repeat protein [Elusimicrobia bacterium]|nr:tetratricopeptide repeat protein [Elusimicrobiota bacterium]